MGFFDRPVTPFETSQTQQKQERVEREQERAELAGYAKEPGPVRRVDEEPVLWGIHDRMPQVESLAIAKAVVGAMKNAASAAFHTVKGDYGDAIDKIGELAGNALDLTGTIVVGDAQEKLESIHLARSVLIDQAQAHSFNEALDMAAAAQHQLISSQSAVGRALRNQQTKYSSFATSSVAQLNGHDDS